MPLEVSVPLAVTVPGALPAVTFKDVAKAALPPLLMVSVFMILFDGSKYNEDAFPPITNPEDAFPFMKPVVLPVNVPSISNECPFRSTLVPDAIVRFGTITSVASLGWLGVPAGIITVVHVAEGRRLSDQFEVVFQSVLVRPVQRL